MKSAYRVSGNGLKRLQASAKQLAGKPRVKIGVLGGGDHGPDLTNAELATIHEFGAPRAGIPERSFLRGTFDAKNREWQKFAEKLLKAIAAGRIDADQALGLLGERAVADVRKTIRNGIDPPLKAATVRRKGSSKPLIDTGRLLQSISWSIER